MKQRIVKHRIQQALSLASLSYCKRRGVGAVAVTSDNITISEAYNGWIRSSQDNTCGEQNSCKRNTLNITSGQRSEIGCVHAEENLIINAARTNNSLMDTVVFITTYPCLSCAKLLTQSGVKKVYAISQSYPSSDGIEFLIKMNVQVQKVNPDDF